MKLKIKNYNGTMTLNDELQFIYENYGLERDSMLDSNAIELKIAILTILKYLEVNSFIEWEDKE